MEELIPTNSIFDNSGTNNLPLNCGWINGKINTRGKKHIHKIRDFHYESFIMHKGSRILRNRLQNWKYPFTQSERAL